MYKASIFSFSFSLKIIRFFCPNLYHNIPALNDLFTRPIPSSGTASKLFELLEMWKYNNDL
jgi:hypothetical protein